MHLALRHALHHWTMSLHASISLNSGFRSMPLPGAGHVQPGRLLPIDSVCKTDAAGLSVLWNRRKVHSAIRRGGGGWVGAGHWPVWWVGGNRTRASKGGWVGDPTLSAKNTLCNTVGFLNYSLYP